MRSQLEAVQDELEHCSERAEAHNALVLVLQDLNAGNVGIKGHEFFTCTFGFIGTVSVICGFNRSMQFYWCGVAYYVIRPFRYSEQ